MAGLPPAELTLQSLHRLKDKIKQVSYLGEHSRFIAEHLPELLQLTWNAVQPPRQQGHRLDRDLTEEIDESEEERLWERALLMRFQQPGMLPVPRGWKRLIAFQVPLYSQQQQEGWGEIDLLGAYEGVPSIIELKRSPSSSLEGVVDQTETPLRMVLEATAYAVAVRRNWTALREEFIARCQFLGMDTNNVPDTLNEKNIPVVAVAPAAFWMNWLPVTTRGQRVAPDAWNAFQVLITKLEEQHYPVRFVSVNGCFHQPARLSAQAIYFPPVGL